MSKVNESSKKKKNIFCTQGGMEVFENLTTKMMQIVIVLLQNIKFGEISILFFHSTTVY